MFSAIQLNLMAQQFFPIPVDTTSAWRILREYNDESCVYYYNSIYYVDGTVIHNGKKYYKIYEEGHYSTSDVNPMFPCSGGSYDYSGVFRGAIRTENRKTYQFINGYAYLLMDFTLNVGDTMYSYLTQEGKIIESIDSVLVGNEYRKRFNFQNSSFGYCNWMIEGIGHERGLFETMDYPFESWSDFYCYGENGIPIFGDENCDITVGKIEKKSLINDIKIYPNPAYNNITINLSEPSAKIKSYSITDIYGKSLINKNANLNKNILTINIKKYESGIYLLSITTNENKTFVRKIIKK